MNENKFNGIGNIYAKFRPNYPREFLNYAYTYVGATEKSVFADIGAGTGILTGQILNEGNKVYSVEPNKDMRKIAEKDLNHFTNFHSIDGAAENTTLADNSIDIITVAQAFHWFDRQSFKCECQRILKCTGQVVLVWNSRDAKSELVTENDNINKKYCPNFKGFSGCMRGATDEDDFSDFFSNEYESKIFNNPLNFDKDGFIGRNLSSSYALKSHDDNYNEYISDLTILFNKYSENNILIMPNITRSYIGKV